MFAGDGGAVIWPQLIGILEQRNINDRRQHQGGDAARMGLINHAIPAAELDATVGAMARRLADGPRDAIRWSKVSANIGLKQLAHSILDASMAYEMVTMHSASHQEAIESFAEGRKPNFKGL